MARLEELKQKYQPVLDTIAAKGVSLAHLHVQDNKLFVQGAAPSEAIKNEVWDQIKKIDPSYADLTAEITVDSSLPQPAAQSAAASAGGGSTKTYTVQSGDTLSKIAKEFYGNANSYNKIFEANRDQLDDPDKIKVGQTLVIP